MYASHEIICSSDSSYRTLTYGGLVQCIPNTPIYQLEIFTSMIETVIMIDMS